MSGPGHPLPRGYADPNRDLGVASGLVLVGILVPIGVNLLAHDLLALYLTAAAATTVAAVAVGFGLWLAVEWRDLDRPNVAVASVLVPAVVLAAVIFVAPFGLFDVLPDHLRVDFGELFGYLAAVSLAGLGAVGLSRALEETGRTPEARRVAAGVAVVLVVGVALAGGANYAAASSARVTDVGAGLAPVSDPALNVTVEGATAEMRVTVVGPTGAAVTERLTRRELAEGRATVSARLWPDRTDETPPPGYLAKRSGTYRIRVSSLAGVTVDTATFTADPGVALAVVETASARGPLEWNRSDPGSQHEVRVGVAVTNRGAFHTSAVATVDVPGGDDPHSRRHYFDPGETEAVVVGIPPEAVETLRANGTDTVTVTVEPAFDGADGATTVEVPLPPPSG
jgi:hypothetical protein